MNLEELRIFSVVVETGSFKTAAKTLNTSRTTIRRRIEELEERVGTALLIRNRQGVTATAAGDMLAKRSQGIVESAQRLLSSVQETQKVPTGNVTFLFPKGAAPHTLIPFFHQMRKQYPRINLIIKFSENPLQDLSEDVDFAFYFGERYPRGAWKSKTLLRLQEKVFASETYLRRRGRPKTFDELAAHTIFTWKKPEDDPCLWPLSGGGHIPISPRSVTSDIHLAHYAILTGLGIGLLPDSALVRHPQWSEPLIPLFEKKIGRTWPVRMIWREESAQLPRIRAVLSQTHTIRV